MTEDIFNNALNGLRRAAGGRFKIEPTSGATPQKHGTTQPLSRMTKTPVRLLVGPLHLPPTYTNSGKLRARQPLPMEVGDIAYARLGHDGLVAIYPFDMAGSGYELVKDARESVHYEFMA